MFKNVAELLNVVEREPIRAKKRIRSGSSHGAKRIKPRRLNLGCGGDIRRGYVNLDIVYLPGVNVLHDLDTIPYPFKTDTFDEIYASHTIRDLVQTMRELHRILRPGGVVKVMVPYFASPNAFRDPTHKVSFTSATYTYFAPHHSYHTPSFIVKKRRLLFFSCASFLKSRWYSWPIDVIINAITPVYERCFCYLFPASEIHFLLEVKK